MSEIVFLNNEPDQDGARVQNKPEHPEAGREEEPFGKSEEIRSEDYTQIKPFFASRYGNSRLFTAQNNGRKVVLKALKKERCNEPKSKAALRQEYDVTSALDNKFVRKALDYVSIQGLGDCIVLEFVEGKTLAEHVRVGSLSEKQVKNILIDVCDALAYMHRNQVVHSNLKPENILVTASDYRVKLIDLGVPMTDDETDRELLIKEMEFVAPEIIKGEESDSRSDIYSLGKIMEFFGERNITKQYNAVATHCTQFSKEQRYESISEVKSAITKGHSVLRVFIVLLALALLGGLAFVYVPKIKANIEKERAERMAFDFERAVENMQDELPALCRKYKVHSIYEPLALNWDADSLRFAQRLMPFFGSEEYKVKALDALDKQRAYVEANRVQEFNALLLNEFKNANDSLAMALKTVMPEQDDSLLLVEANKWFNMRK